MPLLYACPFDLLESDPNVKIMDTTKRHAELLYLLLNCRSRSLSATSPWSSSYSSTSPLSTTTTSTTLTSTSSSTSSSIKEAQVEPEPEHHEGEPGETEESLWANLPPVCKTFEAEHQELKNPLVDYLAAYNHHSLCMNLSSTFRILFPNIQRHSPRVVLSNSPPGSDQEDGSTKPSAAGGGGGTTVTTFTRSEIERTFLLHRPDLIQTISLPIQRLRTFLAIGSKLSRLSRFELYGVTWYFDLDETIRFLARHAKEHGTIQELKMAGPHDVRQLQKPSLVLLLQTLKKPRVIDLSRYKEATKDLNNFKVEDLSRLETLLFDLDFVPPLPDQSPAPSPPSSPPPHPQELGPWARPIKEEEEDDRDDSSLAMVRRCTSLTHLQIGIQSADAFAWAVSWSSESQRRRRPLMPLKTLNLSSNKTPILKTALEDALLAFQHTLESVKAVAIKLYAVMEPSAMPPSFGWSWLLPRLKSLSMRGEIAAWFEFESLRYCPLLTELNMTLHPYTPPKLDHLNGLVLAPNLTSLALAGRWVLSDGLMRLLSRGLPKLTRLCLDGCQTNELTTNGLCTGLGRMLVLDELEMALGHALEAAAKAALAQSRPEVRFTQWNTLQAEQK